MPHSLNQRLNSAKALLTSGAIPLRHLKLHQQPSKPKVHGEILVKIGR
jgi:hypothetical protein